MTQQNVPCESLSVCCVGSGLAWIDRFAPKILRPVARVGVRIGVFVFVLDSLCEFF